MVIGHIAGHHDSQPPLQLLFHLLGSWAGLIITATIVSAVLYFIYKTYKLYAERVRIKK